MINSAIVSRDVEIRRLRGVINKTNIKLEDEMYKVHIATTALKEIANEEVTHTKLNQQRLCCKFKDIASRVLRDVSEVKND